MFIRHRECCHHSWLSEFQLTVRVRTVKQLVHNLSISPVSIFRLSGLELLKLQGVRAVGPEADEAKVGPEYFLPMIDPLFCDVDQASKDTTHRMDFRMINPSMFAALHSINSIPQICGEAFEQQAR